MIRRTDRKYLGTILITAVSLVALAPAVFATTDEDALPRATLNTAHVDFTSTKALAHLKSRIGHVASDICAPDGIGNRLMTNDERRCYDTAMNSGLVQVESKRQLALSRTTVDVAIAQPAEQPAH